MADQEQLRILQQGVEAWNDWRLKVGDIPIKFIGANLSGKDLRGAHLHWAFFHRTFLSGADLSGAFLSGAIMSKVSLSGANLSGAFLSRARIMKATLSDANFSKADLSWASLSGVNLSRATLKGAVLKGADLSGANLGEADLRGADLSRARFVETNLTKADLTGCRIYGISVWDVMLSSDTEQQDLIITPKDETEITIDNIEVAQFIYLLLHNEKIRDVIDTITSNAVLILGRFTEERKAVLDALRDELRKRDYLPILFDFDKPASKDLTGTVTTLANMARFIIADGTDPKSIPHEMATVVPSTLVPIQPILLVGQREYAMFEDLRLRHHWVLPTHRYTTQQQLIADLGEYVIRPAEDNTNRPDR